MDPELELQVDELLQRNTSTGPKDSDYLDIYSWIDSVHFSRPKKNVSRDFSDGVLMAELIHHYLPKLVDKKQFFSASSRRNKEINWSHLNNKVFSKLGYKLEKKIVDEVIDSKPGVIEKVLFQLRPYLAKLNRSILNYRVGKPSTPSFYFQHPRSNYNNFCSVPGKVYETHPYLRPLSHQGVRIHDYSKETNQSLHRPFISRPRTAPRLNTIAPVTKDRKQTNSRQVKRQKQILKTNRRPMTANQLCTRAQKKSSENIFASNSTSILDQNRDLGSQNVEYHFPKPEMTFDAVNDHKPKYTDTTADNSTLVLPSNEDLHYSGNSKSIGERYSDKSQNSGTDQNQNNPVTTTTVETLFLVSEEIFLSGNFDEGPSGRFFGDGGGENNSSQLSQNTVDLGMFGFI